MTTVQCAGIIPTLTSMIRFLVARAVPIRGDGNLKFRNMITSKSSHVVVGRPRLLEPFERFSTSFIILYA